MTVDEIALALGRLEAGEHFVLEFKNPPTEKEQQQIGLDLSVKSGIVFAQEMIDGRSMKITRLRS